MMEMVEKRGLCKSEFTKSLRRTLRMREFRHLPKTKTTGQG